MDKGKRQAVSSLGTFEGFNFRDNAAIPRILSADEVIQWDHDSQGEAEFWPAGDRPGLALIFSGRSTVTGSELAALDALLQQLDANDEVFSCLQIRHALERSGGDIFTITQEQIES